MEVAALGNFSIFFVIELLFAQQDYRTIHFLSEERPNDLSNKIIQIASNSLMKPISHFDFGETNIMKKYCEEPILNVLFLNYLHNETNVDRVRPNIFPDDVTLLLPSRNADDTDENVEYMKMWMNLSAKVILLTQNLTIFLNDAFEREFSSKVDLFTFDTNSTRSLIRNMFSTDYFPRPHSDYNLFFQYFPPKSSIGRIDDNLIWIGPDGSIAEAIIKALKVTPILSTDLGFSYPNYKEWGTDPIISSRMIYQTYYPRVMTKNAVKIFNKSISDSMDLQLSPYNVYRDSALFTEALYPHEKDCLVVMVPKQVKSEEFLQKVTREPDIQSIFLALILFAIVRMMIEQSSWKQWISISIKSLGIFLNQDKLQNRTRVEVAWEVNLRCFSILATIALSVIIYKNLMSKKYVEIDTIEDLIASNLTIIAPDYLKDDEILRSNLKHALYPKIIFKGINELNYDVVTRRMFNYAYIFSDSGAEYMDMMLHVYTSSAKSYKRMIRTMHEKLHCRLSGYRISKSSPLKTYLNDFVRRFVECGLYDRHLEWIRQLNRACFQVNKYKIARTDGKDPVVLNMDLVFGIFALYMVGVVISVVIFLFELKL